LIQTITFNDYFLK